MVHFIVIWTNEKSESLIAFFCLERKFKKSDESKLYSENYTKITALGQVIVEPVIAIAINKLFFVYR